MLLRVTIVTEGNKFILWDVIRISMSARRKRERERKTNEIIDAAEKEYFSKGFNKTTMETIATRLELTKPALYRYFNSKEDLYYAVVLRGTVILAEMMKKEVDSKETGIGKICATGIAYCKFYREFPDYCRLMLNAKNSPTQGVNCLNLQELSKYNNNNISIMCNAIETGKEDGTIRTDIDTVMSALFLIESTIAVMQLSDNMEVIGMSDSKEDFIMHSLMLMGNSLKNLNIKSKGELYK